MRQIIFILLTLLFLVATLITVKAQPSEPGYPAALIYHLPAENLPVVNLPYFNNEDLKAADTCESWRICKVLVVSIL